jgi:hypothetical protein
MSGAAGGVKITIRKRRKSGEVKMLKRRKSKMMQMVSEKEFLSVYASRLKHRRGEDSCVLPFCGRINLHKY